MMFGLKKNPNPSMGFANGWFKMILRSYCDAPNPGGPLTTRQPAEYSWMSGNPTPLMKIE